MRVAMRHPVEGFQEAALLRVNICSALGLGRSITACGPSHSDHRTPISGPISGTCSHRLGEPHLTLAMVSCLPSFIPRLETGPRRERVRRMPQPSPTLLSYCHQGGGGGWNLGTVPPGFPPTSELSFGKHFLGAHLIPKKMKKEKGWACSWGGGGELLCV